MKITLSIVIPVFNGEKFIADAITNAHEKLKGKGEIIVVDDASTDATGQICCELATQYADVKYIRHEINRGASCSRNDGIEWASGEYVWFIDSDDNITDNAIDSILKEIENKSADVYYFSFQEVMGGKQNLYSFKRKEQILLDDKIRAKFGCWFLRNDFGYAVWNKVYSMALFKQYGDLRFFEELRIGEDICFNMEVISKSGCIVVSEGCIYQYVRRTGSVSYEERTVRHINELIKGCWAVLSFCNKDDFDVWLIGFYQIALSRKWDGTIIQELMSVTSTIENESKFFLKRKRNLEQYIKFYGKRWGIYMYCCRGVVFYVAKKNHFLSHFWILAAKKMKGLL